ncbi:MAG: T9SS type A sorting domain-containing protein [Elusimicrobiota bacterium]|jgi:endoglucanase Acf2|nr:T9SS type A sorting domain-containing protein [Elusimicrobiota bacterium]
MKIIMKKILIYLWLFNLFLVVFLRAANIGSASYRDDAPYTSFNGTIYQDFENISKPIITNKWWSSILFHRFSQNMFAFPMNYKVSRKDENNSDGLTIGTPDYIEADSVGIYGKFRRHLLIGASVKNTTHLINSVDVRVRDYTDWILKSRWRDVNNEYNYFDATFGQGLVFTYFNFSSNLNARISTPFSWDIGTFYVYNFDEKNTAHRGTDITHAIYGQCRKLTTDRFLIQVAGDLIEEQNGWEKSYYGVFLPEETTVYLLNYNTEGEYGYKSIVIDFGNNPSQNRYISIALLKQYSQPNYATNNTTNQLQINENIDNLNDYYNYAYNFVINTQLEYSVDEEYGKVKNRYIFTTQKVRTDIAQNSGTLFATFPHHYKNNISGSSLFKNIEYNTLRGKMKLYAGSYFETTLNFNGIIPFFDEKGLDDTSVETLNTYINSYTIDLNSESLYFFGKQASNVANLIRIADKVGNLAKKTEFQNALRNALIGWFTYSGGKYFYKNEMLNSLLSYPDSFGSENMNDHHFHYGYVVYAAAILAYYDSDFRSNYGGIVEYLIKDYANYDRNDTSAIKFPFLRNFEIYEGHNYANGFSHDSDADANKDFGTDQESSSESMNAWAGIYLWGLLADKEDYKKLGIFGYTTEYSAIQNYWYNLDGDIYPISYNKKSIGILFGGKVIYNVWFDSSSVGNFLNEFVFGIQMLPLNPTSLYLGYNEQYLNDNYNSFLNTNSRQDARTWQDIFWQYIAMFNSSNAISKMVANIDKIQFESSNKPYLYYWINSFSKFGKIDTSVYANISSAAVFEKAGEKTYLVFNANKSTSKTVTFRNRLTNVTLGHYIVPPNTLVLLNKLPNSSVVPPTPINEIFQGNVEGINIALDKNNKIISANWDGAISEKTGVERYSYSIGTTPGGTNIVNWTDVWATSFTKTFSSLDNGKYYINVKSKSYIGEESQVTTSSGYTLSSDNIPNLIHLNHGISNLEDEKFSNSNMSLNANWNFNNATSYEYAFSKSSTTVPSSLQSTNTKMVSINFEGGLDNKTTYYLYLKAKNGSIESGIIRSRGIYIYRNEPKVDITFDEGEPLPSGVLNMTLNITNDIDVKNDVKLFYNFETSVSTFPVIFTKTDINTFKAQIQIAFNQLDKYIKFFSLIVQDLAGNTTNTINSGTSFSVDTSIDNNKDTTIIADDGVEIFIPKGTFDEKVVIDVIKKDKNDKKIDNTNMNIKDNEAKDFAYNFGIFKEFIARNYNTGEIVSNFNKNVSIKIRYNDSNKDRLIDGSKVSVNQISVFCLDESSYAWEPMKKVETDYINTRLIAEIPHFSIYAILQISSFSNLDQVRLYPNPFYPNKSKKINIDRLPNIYDSLDIWIYDISGKLIKKLDTTNIEKKFDGDFITWDGKTDTGAKVASGVYIVFIKTNFGVKKEKLAILW